MRSFKTSLAVAAALAFASLDASAQCGGTLPEITSFSPSSVPCVSTTPTVVTISGCNFNGTNQVLVDGMVMSTFPSTYTIVSDTVIELTMPLVSDTGPIPIQISNGAGTGVAASLNVLPLANPVLKVSNQWLFSAIPNPMVVGGAHGDQYWLLGAREVGAASIPGVVDLAIGPSIGQVVMFGQRAIGSKGWDEIDVMLPGLPTGTVVHFQAAVWQALNPAGPLATTNVETRTLLF